MTGHRPSEASPPAPSPAKERTALGIVVTCAGGLMDAYSYLMHGEVFANGQTGNVVLLVLRLSEADYDKVLDTNLKGAVFCCKAVSRLMMKQRYGRIINMSSVVGLRGNAGQVNYAASKAGLIGLTKSLAKELATRGVTVNAVAPGFVGTEMTDAMPEAAKAATLAAIPAGRIADPDEIARAVEFFAAEGSGYITGQVLCVDGGMAM